MQHQTATLGGGRSGEGRGSGRFLELKRAWRTLCRSQSTLLGIGFMAVMLFLAAAAPVLAPYEFDEMLLGDRLTGPSRTHLLGTDQFGRDVLARLLYGARVSLFVGLAGTALSMVGGVAAGAMAGFVGGWLDEIVMRILDIWLAFPFIVLAIVLAWILGPGLRNLILVIGIMRLPHFARIVRGSVLSIKQKDYVLATRCVGQRSGRILWRHILPNCITSIIVYASLSVATAISSEAALSFLGLGIQPPAASWGTMLADGQRYMVDAPWIATFPGIAITITILGYNLVGDGVRDALDPHMRRQLQ
jgi:peptide/nickel transport system permease protein